MLMDYLFCINVLSQLTLLMDYLNYINGLSQLY